MVVEEGERGLESRVSRLEGSIDQINPQIESLDRNLNARMNSIETRMGSLETRMNVQIGLTFGVWATVVGVLLAVIFKG